MIYLFNNVVLKNRNLEILLKQFTYEILYIKVNQRINLKNVLLKDNKS